MLHPVSIKLTDMLLLKERVSMLKFPPSFIARAVFYVILKKSGRPDAEL
jgi:hypothetical protein